MACRLLEHAPVEAIWAERGPRVRRGQIVARYLRLYRGTVCRRCGEVLAGADLMGEHEEDAVAVAAG